MNQVKNRFRPRLEALEDRTAPATYYWTGVNGGSWENNVNWLVDGQVPTVPPGVNDYVDLDAGGYSFAPIIPEAFALRPPVTIRGLHMDQGTLIYLLGPLVIDAQNSPVGTTVLDEIEILASTDVQKITLKNHPASAPVVFNNKIQTQAGAEGNVQSIVLSNAHAYAGEAFQLYNIDAFVIGANDPVGQSSSLTLPRDGGSLSATTTGGTTTALEIWDRAVLRMEARTGLSDGGGLEQNWGGTKAARVEVKSGGLFEVQGTTPQTHPNLLQWEVILSNGGYMRMLPNAHISLMAGGQPTYKVIQVLADSKLILQDNAKIVGGNNDAVIEVFSSGAIEVTHMVAGSTSYITGWIDFEAGGSIIYNGARGSTLAIDGKLNVAPTGAFGRVYMRVWEWDCDVLTTRGGNGQALNAVQLFVTPAEPLTAGVYSWELITWQAGDTWPQGADIYFDPTVTGHDPANWDLTLAGTSLVLNLLV